MCSNSPWTAHDSQNSQNTGSDLIDDIVAALIPGNATMSSRDMVAAANNEPWKLNPAFGSLDAMQVALEEIGGQSNGNPLPLRFVRIFHPKSFGHIQQSSFEIAAIVASATGQSTGQGQDPPTQHIDLGDLNCKAQHDDGDTKYYFKREDAIAAIDSFCQSCGHDGIVMGVTAALQEEAINGVDVSAEWISAENCPQTDFTKPGTIGTCEARLMNIVDNCKSYLHDLVEISK
jgi:hypothetical protein